MSHLIVGSATFRRLYGALLNANKGRVNVVIRPAQTAQEGAVLKSLPFCECAYAERDRGSPNGRIVFNPDNANDTEILEDWLSHEIVHTAGQYSDVTGVDATCGKGDVISGDCVHGIEMQIRDEMREYEEKQAEERTKKPKEE